MKDYLSHLAARALATEPVIRPRSLSLFEPSPAANMTPGEPLTGTRDAGFGQLDSPIDAVLNTERPVVGQSQPEMRTKGSSTSNRGISISPLNEAERLGKTSKDDSNEPAATAPVAAMRPLLTSRVGRNDRKADDRRKDNAKSASPRGVPKLAVAALRPARTRLAQSDDHSPVEIDREFADALDPDESAIARLVPAPTVVRIERAPAAITASNRPEPPERLAPPRHLPAHRALGKLATADPPPAVHVTIGRLEIRAIVPPAAPPRPQPKRDNSSSLENYLRKRSGGTR